MIAIKNPEDLQEFVVVHPMFDAEEKKCDGAGLERLKMSPAVRFSMVAMRAYIFIVCLLLAFHLLEQAGLLGHPISR